jgi:uncharacterized membrane protein required for colicin V production
MAYILDGLVIIIFLLAVWLGYRRGFFKSIIQLVGCIAAVMIASGLSAPLAAGIYDQFFSKSIQGQIQDQIEKAGTESVETALGGVLDELPDSVVNALSLFDLGTAEQVKDKLSDSLEGSVTQISQHVEQQVVRPAAVSLLRVLCFFILFILFTVFVGIIASAVGKLFKLPVLRQADGLLGAMLGAVQGIVLVFVAVTVMSLIASTSKSDDKLTRAVMNDTILVQSVEKVNPMTDTLDSMFGAKSV